jgi:hypothetical protein
MMAQPKWLEKYLRMKPEVSNIYEDLENYREFCVSHGRQFNEAALYNERDRDYVDFLKFQERGYAKNHWNWANKDPNEIPRRPFNRNNNHGGGYRGNNNYRSGGYNRNA